MSAPDTVVVTVGGPDVKVITVGAQGPAGPPGGSGAAGGVLTGTYPNPGINLAASAFIAGLLAVSSLAPGSNGQVLTTVGGVPTWSAAGSGFTAGGDLSGTSTSQTVVGIQGRAVASTAPNTGNALLWSGTQWAPGAVNLAGGANSVTGVLPVANLPNLAGDAGGAINANAVSTLTGTAGVVTVASGTIVQFGTGTMPSSGLIRFPNTTGIANLLEQRDTINTLDLPILSTAPNSYIGYLGDTANPGVKWNVMRVAAIAVQLYATTGGVQFMDSTSTEAARIVVAGTGASKLQFASTVTSATFNVADTAVTAATGVSAIHAGQNATGTGATVGGNAIVTSGTGATAGNVELQTGGTAQFRVTPTSFVNVNQNPIFWGTGTVPASGDIRWPFIAGPHVLMIQRDNTTLDMPIISTTPSVGYELHIGANTDATTSSFWTRIHLRCAGVIDLHAGSTGQIWSWASTHIWFDSPGAEGYRITPLSSGNTILQAAATCTQVTYKQAPNTAANGSGVFTELRAQDATGTGTCTGGTLNLRAGSGTNASTWGQIQMFTNTVLFVDPTGVVTVTWTVISTSTTSLAINGAATGFSITHLTSATVGGPLTISAQNAGATANNGGKLILQGGQKTTTGLRGGIRLDHSTLASDGDCALELAEVVSGNRIIAMHFLGPITSTQMPANTGDGVTFVANRQTAPTANASGGGILYAEAGALKWRGSAGTTTTLAVA